MSRYLAHHVVHRRLDKGIKDRTIKHFIQSFDPSKSYILKSEEQAMYAKLRKVFAQNRWSTCQELQEVQATVLKRVKEVEDFVRKTVNRKSYKLDTTVELKTDPDKRDYPETVAARNALVLKYIHFQMSNYLESDTKMPEAKKQLTHRYELITKRIKDRDPQEIMSIFLNGFARALDPHSSYFSPDDLEDFRIQMSLSLEGIGVSLTSKDGFTVVEKIIPGGAAAKVDSLKPKDKILGVSQDGKKFVDIVDMELRDVVKLIRGKKGTPVTLSILRKGAETKRFNTKIVRDKINLKEQAAKVEYKDIKRDGKSYKVAVLDLPSFYGDRKRSAYDDVKKLLNEVKDKNVDGVILDLSRNSGGLLDDAVRISGLFIREGGVVATRLSKRAPEVLPDEDPRIFYSGPLIVLTSRLSASASEIVAGAIKDYRRGIVVGDDHTFGKGTVQSVVDIAAGLGALKITTGMFFRPSGQSTQRVGVKSHIVTPSVFSSKDFGEGSIDHSLPPQKIQAFYGQKVNYPKTPYRWQPVTDAEINKLRSNSKGRVAKSEDFKDIKKRLAESEKKKDGLVKLADLVKENQESKKKKDKRLSKRMDGKKPVTPEDAQVEADEEDEDKERRQVHLNEALEIMGDFVKMRGGGKKASAAKGGSKGQG